MNFLVASLLLVIIGPAAFCQATELDKLALELALRVLDARQEELPLPEGDERREKVSDLLRSLFDDGRPAAAEAIAILLGFDLGVDCDQALLFEVKLRGKAILPYLSLYRDNRGPVGKEYPPVMLLSANQRNQRYGEATAAIRTGKLPVLNREVARLLIPFLDARYEFLKELRSPRPDYPSSLEDRAMKRLDVLMDNKSAAADEAVVVLMDYQLDGHAAEEQWEALSERRKRLLPYLRRHRYQYVVIPGRKYPYSMRHNFERRKRGADYIINALEKGEDPWERR